MPLDIGSPSPSVRLESIKSGDTIWAGRFPGDRRVRLFIEGRLGADTLNCTVLAAAGGIAKLRQDPIDGSTFFCGPSGERGKPVYITEIEDEF